MALSKVASNIQRGVTSQTIDISGTGYAAGDIMYIDGTFRGGSATTFTDPSGFTQVKDADSGGSGAGDVRKRTWRRVLTASESNPTVAWATDGGAAGSLSWVIWRGGDNTTPEDVVGAAASADAGAGTLAATGVTIATGGAELMDFFGMNDAPSAITDDGAMTPDQKQLLRPGNSFARETRASTGATGTRTTTWTGGTAGRKAVAYLIAVRPAAGPTTRNFTAQLQAVALLQATLTVTTPTPPIPSLPKLNIIVNWEGATRTIGPGMNTEGYVLTEFGDEMPGGYADLEFLILATEYDAYKTTVYKYMADVKVRIDASEADGSTTIWQGFMLNPSPGPEVTVPNADGTGTVTQGTYILKCVGYQQLVKDRDSPMPWQTRFVGDMFTGSDEPADDALENADSIGVSVKTGAVVFDIPKGTEIKQDDRSGAYFWAGEEAWIKVHRFAGRVVKKKGVPGGTTTPNYRLKAVRYAGPTGPATRYVVADLTSALEGVGSTTFDQSMGNERPMVGFELIRTGPNVDETLASYKFSLKGLRFNGNNLVAADTHTGRQMVLDMATKLGFGTARVATKLNDGVTDIPNMLPLWWIGESWELLFEYLAQGLAFKWGIWEIGANGPIIEFRGWEDSNTTWYVDAYGPTAFAKAQLKPADNDKYSHVVVFYKLVGKAKWARKIVEINPNPFAGLNPPRERPFKFVIPDPVPDTVLPTQIANQLALEYANDIYSGTIDLSYAYDAASSGNARTAQLMHAGQKVRVRDFPGGARTFRIYRTYKHEANVRLEMGRIPLRVDKLLWWQQRRRMMLGKIASMG